VAVLVAEHLFIRSLTVVQSHGFDRCSFYTGFPSGISRAQRMDIPLSRKENTGCLEVYVQSKESGREGSDDTLKELRDLVRRVATEIDPDTVHNLFEQIRNLLRVQLAETERRIKALKNPNRTKIQKSQDRFKYSA
jgi:hypothetical protein